MNPEQDEREFFAIEGTISGCSRPVFYAGAALMTFSKARAALYARLDEAKNVFNKLASKSSVEDKLFVPYRILYVRKTVRVEEVSPETDADALTGHDSPADSVER